MKFTVIIPTRERSDRLFYALKTCVTQDYDNLEILVSDNFSQDKTREIVESFKDPRIRYINTGKRVSMTSNWEFALSHVQDGYVTYVGDDDGLLPSAVTDVARIAHKYAPPAIIWRKVEYTWPCHPTLPNYMLLPVSNRLVRTATAPLLRAMISFRTSYNRGPCIYNGFVHISTVQRLRQKNGRFFASVTPDVYSSFALCSVMNWFLYSTRPFSVNGGSSHSNGTKACQAAIGEDSGGQGGGDRFFEEIDLPVHDQMQLLPANVTSVVAEAMLQANDACYGGALRISSWTHVRKIIKEYSYRPKDTYERGISALRCFAEKRALGWFVNLCVKLYPHKPNSQGKPSSGVTPHGDVVVYMDQFGVHDVFEAATLASRFLGKYTIPDKLERYRPLNRYTSFLQRKVAPYLTVP